MLVGVAVERKPHCLPSARSDSASVLPRPAPALEEASVSRDTVLTDGDRSVSAHDEHPCIALPMSAERTVRGRDDVCRRVARPDWAIDRSHVTTVATYVMGNVASARTGQNHRLRCTLPLLAQCES